PRFLPSPSEAWGKVPAAPRPRMRNSLSSAVGAVPMRAEGGWIAASEITVRGFSFAQNSSISPIRKLQVIAKNAQTERHRRKPPRCGGGRFLPPRALFQRAHDQGPG